MERELLIEEVKTLLDLVDRNSTALARLIGSDSRGRASVASTFARRFPRRTKRQPSSPSSRIQRLIVRWSLLFMPSPGC